VNKESERLYFDKFKELSPNFPPGKICSEERPDFLVKAENATIGIEITKYYREISSEGHPALQQRESARRKIIAQAKYNYDLTNLAPMHVHVFFDFNFHCSQREIHTYATRLAHLAERSAQENKDNWWRDEVQLNGVHSMDVKRTTLAKSFWSAPLGSFVPEVSCPQLQTILDKKNALCADYRKKCDEVWLVIAIDRLQPASFARIPEGIQDHPFAHDFDSAFLFFRDYDGDKTAPILMRKA